MELKGRTAIITGAGTGIGRALAREFARQGASVACLGRRRDKLDQTVALIQSAGGTAIALPTDVTQVDQVDRAVAAVLERFGRIDVLYNNAGNFNALGGLWEVDPEVWWQDVAVNLRGVMLGCRAVLPSMMQRQEGVIINMLGGGAVVPLAGGSGYGSSKAAMLRLTETLARELERVNSKVLVVALGPGFVRTEMTMLQVTTEPGRRWIPGSKEALDAGKDRPPEDCAHSAVELLRVICPQFNGRIFETGMDFAAVARRATEIKEKNLGVLRLVPMK